MDQSKGNQLSKWSDLCPDLLRCIFNRLSFTTFNQAKTVCKSWNSVSKCCVHTRNQIPWLILFPQEEKNSNRCALFIPDDKYNIYKTRDLGLVFRKSDCLGTYGSWLFMFHFRRWSVYIFNPLTLETIDLPKPPLLVSYNRACLWVDDFTKDYLVILCMNQDNIAFTKKGDVTWRNVHYIRGLVQIVYNRKDAKVYACARDGRVAVWDFSGDIPHLDGSLVAFEAYSLEHCSFQEKNLWARIATTVLGEVLYVRCYMDEYSRYRFHIYEFNSLRNEWVKVDSLGDEALILDMGFTVVANKIPGFKRNSIYFSEHNYNLGYAIRPDHVFMYDLTIRTVERLPQCIFSSRGFSHAQWFFPDLTH